MLEVKYEKIVDDAWFVGAMDLDIEHGVCVET